MSTQVTKKILKLNGMEFLCRCAGLDQDGELVVFFH
jgi:hypothetical protein